jgi:hypothetical protein
MFLLAGRTCATAATTIYGPCWSKLHLHLDRRLVNNQLGLVLAMILLRHHNHGLLMSELGGYLLNPDQAPAGTKRVGRVLHSRRWSSADLEAFLWEQAQQRIQTLAVEGETILAIWDQSVLEKAESLTLEGLCPVKSSKAMRLKRIKPGFFNPPGGRPVFVPGYHWLQIRVLGMQSAPSRLAATTLVSLHGRLVLEGPSASLPSADRPEPFVVGVPNTVSDPAAQLTRWLIAWGNSIRKGFPSEKLRPSAARMM